MQVHCVEGGPPSFHCRGSVLRLFSFPALYLYFLQVHRYTCAWNEVFFRNIFLSYLWNFRECTVYSFFYIYTYKYLYEHTHMQSIVYSLLTPTASWSKSKWKYCERVDLIPAPAIWVKLVWILKVFVTLSSWVLTHENHCLVVPENIKNSMTCIPYIALNLWGA